MSRSRTWFSAEARRLETLQVDALEEDFEVRLLELGCLEPPDESGDPSDDGIHVPGCQAHAARIVRPTLATG